MVCDYPHAPCATLNQNCPKVQYFNQPCPPLLCVLSQFLSVNTEINIGNTKCIYRVSIKHFFLLRL